MGALQKMFLNADVGRDCMRVGPSSEVCLLKHTSLVTCTCSWLRGDLYISLRGCKHTLCTPQMMGMPAAADGICVTYMYVTLQVVCACHALHKKRKLLACPHRHDAANLRHPQCLICELLGQTNRCGHTSPAPSINALLPILGNPQTHLSVEIGGCWV